MTIIDKIRDFFCLKDEPGKARQPFSTEILREYDIRGVVGDNLFPEGAYDIGKAFGTLLLRKNLKKVCVGQDCRISSDSLSRSLTRGLMDSGAEVISLGVCHTPLVYYAVNKFAFDAGIMTTGSHNPPNYNGFKFMLGLDPFYGDSIRELGNMIINRDFVDGSGREIVMNNIFSSYVNDILGDFDFSDDIKIAWDVGNGATSNAVNAITALIRGKHHVLFEEMDGTFPNRSPDPTIAENIKYLLKFVVYNEFDLGFAFDSDGDRLCVVNRKGEALHSDQVLSVFARNFLERNPGAQVIADVKSCNQVFDTIRTCGGIGIMERVGHSFIKAKMKSSGALLAGEMSGHFFFKDRWLGFDDGIYAALRCIEILCNDRNAFDNLQYGLVTPEIRIACDEAEKSAIVDAVKAKIKQDMIAVVEIDGVRVSTDNGWWILRASNTQNALSLRVEYYSKKTMGKLKEQIVRYLREYVPDIDVILNSYTEQL
jgi:phosphomannomutase